MSPRRPDSPSFVTAAPYSGTASPSIRSVLKRFGGFAPRSASAAAPTHSVSVLMKRSIDRSQGDSSPGL